MGRGQELLLVVLLVLLGGRRLLLLLWAGGTARALERRTARDEGCHLSDRPPALFLRLDYFQGNHGRQSSTRPRRQSIDSPFPTPARDVATSPYQFYEPI